MNIINLYFMRLIQNKIELTETLKNKILADANRFVYPVGNYIIAITDYPTTYTAFNERLQHYNNLAHELYTDIYTEDEQKIIGMYGTLSSLDYLSLTQAQLNAIKEIFSYTSEKLEIQYMYNTIKYKYARALIILYPNNSEIDLLLEELEAAPDAKESDFIALNDAN